MTAYDTSKNEEYPVWVHFHCEHIDVEDLDDIRDGETLQQRAKYMRSFG